MVITSFIPDALTGRDFLAASHYKLSQDERFTPGALKSLFQKDYVPPPVNKPGAVPPPRPADFMHQDTAKISMRISETNEEYPKKKIPPADQRDKYSFLYKTHFKMNSSDRIDTFLTTHDEHYKPVPSTHISQVQSTKAWNKSSFPQGDREKADDPVSTYRGSYPDHDIQAQNVKYIDYRSMEGKSAFKGDNHWRFDTTHDTDFMPVPLDPAKLVPRHFDSCLPKGDRERFKVGMSTMRHSFQPNEIEYEPRDYMKAHKKLYATNHKMDDTKGKIDNYSTTQADSYRPVLRSEPKFKRDRDRNASDIPEGDHDPQRGHDRVSTSMTRSQFKKPDLHGVRVPRVSGPDLRTVSNIKIGVDDQASKFYDTTCDSTYKAVSVPYHLARAPASVSIPLKLYGDRTGNATTASDFLPQKATRIIINKAALSDLRATHFFPPLDQERFFSTTHQSHYTPKDMKKVVPDQHRLQRSSLPIGTLGQYIQGCYNGY